jgi:hypothetical protein
MASSKETELKSVLNTLTRSLKILSTRYPKDKEKKFSYTTIFLDGFQKLIQGIFPYSLYTFIK